MALYAILEPSGEYEPRSAIGIGSGSGIPPTFVPLTATLKSRILALTAQYGTGRDTLRCLALAVADNPIKVEDMDLNDANKFYTYEVNLTFVGVVGMLDPPR